jgi:hypothetical protein
MAIISASSNWDANLPQRPSTTDSRSAYDAELAKLNESLARGDYAYGGADAAINAIYQNFGIPAGVSYQEAQSTIGGLYNQYYAPTQEAGATAPTGTPYTPPNTGGTDTTALTQSIADLEAQQAAVRSQFEPLYAQYISELQSGLKTGKENLRKDYLSNAELNDTRYGEGLQNIQRGYAARGIGDSSYKETAQSGLTGDFNRIYGDLTSQYDKGNTELDKQVADKTKAADATKNNFYNPTRPQFTDMNQVASYSGQLGSQLENAKSQLSSANAAVTSQGIYNPAGDDKMFQEYAGAQVEAGTPWGTVASTLKERGQTDPSYDAYLSYLYGSKESDPYKYMNPTKAKYLY